MSGAGAPALIGKQHRRGGKFQPRALAAEIQKTVGVVPVLVDARKVRRGGAFEQFQLRMQDARFPRLEVVFRFRNPEIQMSPDPHDPVRQLIEIGGFKHAEIVVVLVQIGGVDDPKLL